MTEVDLGPVPDPRDLDRLRNDVAVDGETKARVRARLAETVLAAAAVGAAGAGAPRVGRVLGAHTYEARRGRVPRRCRDGSGRLCAAHREVGASRGRGRAHGHGPGPQRPRGAAARVCRGTGRAERRHGTAPEAVGPRLLPPRAAGTSQLSAERHMLDDARHALLQGEPARALEILERHRRAFPAPLLAEEHGALEVQALAKAERYGEARTQGEAFRRRYPDSLYLPMVDAALAAMP